MMLRRAGFCAAIALTVAAVAAIAFRALGATAIEGQPHNLLHVGCPPGSHGKMRTFGAGNALTKARDDARASRWPVVLPQNP